MSPEIQTFLLAMTPLGELRVSLPIALTVFHLDLIKAYFISVLGNMVPVMVLLFFLDPVSNWLSKKFKVFQKFFSWLFEKTRRRHGETIKKYGYPALVIFVGIPLPFTGGWTGSLVAFLFGIPFKLAFPLIFLGVIIAGIIVLIATKTGIAIEKYFGWQTLIGILVIAVSGYIISKKFNNKSVKNFSTGK